MSHVMSLLMSALVSEAKDIICITSPDPVIALQSRGGESKDNCKGDTLVPIRAWIREPLSNVYYSQRVCLCLWGSCPPGFLDVPVELDVTVNQKRWNHFERSSCNIYRYTGYLKQIMIMIDICTSLLQMLKAPYICWNLLHIPWQTM